MASWEGCWLCAQEAQSVLWTAQYPHETSCQPLGPWPQHLVYTEGVLQSPALSISPHSAPEVKLLGSLRRV